jgi:hypothetical protein
MSMPSILEIGLLPLRLQKSAVALYEVNEDKVQCESTRQRGYLRRRYGEAPKQVCYLKRSTESCDESATASRTSKTVAHELHSSSGSSNLPHPASSQNSIENCTSPYTRSRNASNVLERLHVFPVRIKFVLCRISGILSYRASEYEIIGSTIGPSRLVSL